MTRNVLKLEEAKRKFRDALAARFEGKRTTAIAVVTTVDRDPITQYTTGKVRATIDGVADQSVFIGSGTGVAVGDALRVENRAGGIGPEWVMLGKTGSVAGNGESGQAVGVLSTPAITSLTSSTYLVGTAVTARLTVQWTQIADWEGATNYEVAYYLNSDTANQHVSTAPHINGQSSVQYAILGLLPGTAYTVKVRAVGTGGALSSWATSSTTTATDPSIPGVPSGLGASQVSDTALRFYWARNTEADFSRYEIEISSSSSGSPVLVAISTGDTPEYIHNVNPATNRWFRVRSIDTSGNASGWSNSVSPFTWSGPHATVETVSSIINPANIIDQNYGLGILSGKIIVDLASPSGLGFASGNLELLDTVAGAGLTVASKVLAVNPDRLLSIVSDAVGITAGANYQFIGTGSGTAAAWQNLSGLSGGGLTHNTGVLAVGQGLGITVNVDDVALTTPGTLTVATVNSSTGNHVHTITSSSNPGAAASILATDASGYLSLVKLNTDTLADKSGGNLTISPAGDVLLNPTGLDVRLQSGVTIRSENFVSQITGAGAGWGIDYSGGGDFRYLYADEMHVKSFIADLEQALAGGQIISKSVAVLAVTFTAPAAGATTTLTVRDLPSAANMAAFQSGDIVRLRSFSRASGSLTISDCWGAVTSYVDNSGGTQSWTFTRSTAPNAGAMSAGATIQPDAIVLDYGTNANGFYEVNAIDGAYAVNSPYAQIATWSGHPATGQQVRVRTGNLKGVTSLLEYGLWAGENTTDKYLLLSDENFEAHGLKLSLFRSGVETIRLDPVAPSLALGETLPLYFAEPGIWMGRDNNDGKYKLSIDDDAGDHWLRWMHDGSRYYLDIAGNLYLHDSPGAGGDDLGATLTIDSHGQIVMGSNGKISMGSGSSFTAGTGSSFTVGTQGTGAYLSYVNGVLNIEGMITVTDGADFLPAEYRPAAISASFETSFETGTTWNLWGALPYGDDGGYVAGRLETANGNVYTLLAADTVDSTGSRYIKIAVRKTRLAGDFSVGSIAFPNTSYIPGTSCILCYNYTDAQWSALSEDERNNRVVIADAYLTADFSDVVSVSFRSESGISIIGPDFIRTTNLSALSADLGTITGGKITLTNGSNTLWLNDGTNDIVLAAGATAGGIGAAAFRVKEDGSFRAGGVSNNYIDWSGTTLTINGSGTFSGVITATSGSLGSLTVGGNLNVSTSGKIYSGISSWATGTVEGWLMEYNGGDPRFVIGALTSGALTKGLAWDGSNLSIKMTDSTIASLDIGNTALDGFIDISVRTGSGAGNFSSGIHILDGGNATAGVQALFYGQTAQGTNAVDRIFEAYTTHADNVADGFYATIAGGTWSNWASDGVAFKGQSNKAPAVAVQRIGSGLSPTVWASGDGTSAAIYAAVMGASYQTAFYVDNTLGANDIVALNANSTGIENVRFQRFINLSTSTAGAGDAGVPASSSTYEFIIYARNGALRMKNSQYEWIISTNTPVAL